MKVELWAIGKTSDRYLEEGIQLYQSRLRHYLKFEFHALPGLKKAGRYQPEQIKILEGERILKALSPGDHLVLLDERGKQLTSLQLAEYMNHKLQLSHKRLLFLVGGAYGFSQDLYQRAQGKIALSKMTFSHQMARLFMVEQLYRAMTILNNEPYHNE